MNLYPKYIKAIILPPTSANNYMMQNLKQKLHLHLFSCLIVLFYCTEVLNKLVKFYTGEIPNVSRVIKLVVLLVFVFGIVYKKIRYLYLIIGLTALFCIGQIYLHEGFEINVVIVYIKYVFAILTFVFFNIYQLNDTQKKSVFYCFETLILLNSLLIWIGFIFNIDVFSTYQSNRFGFNGLFVASATGSYIYILALFYFILRYKKDVFKSPKNLISLLAILLIGTKAVYVSIIFAGLFYILFYIKSPLRNALVAFIVVIGFFLAYFFFFSWGSFNVIREEKGIITSILSLRDELFLKQTIPFIKEHWRWQNYLFGGVSSLESRSQMGFIDVFYFFGIIGGIYYLWLFYKSYFVFTLNKSHYFLTIIFMLIVFLSGNFFANSSLPFYLLVLREVLKENNFSENQASF